MTKRTNRAKSDELISDELFGDDFMEPEDTAGDGSIELHTGSILRDPSFQVRRKLDKGIIERYAKVYESGNRMPPVEVVRVNDSYVLLEGWHRLAALEKLGRTRVRAIVHDVSKREAYWIAARANLTHGLPLKRSEMREVFRKYIKARKHRNKDGSLRSYREIASDLGGSRSYTTIRNWMAKDFPKIFKEYADDDGPVPEGGLRDEDTGPGPKELAIASINQAIAAFGALESRLIGKRSKRLFRK